MKKHTIDTIFSLSLFMVFVICSFLLLLFQANGYQDISKDNDIYTAISYVKTSIQNHDRLNAIEVQSIEGIDCLVLKQDEEVQYLYVKDGMLKELYQERSLNVSLDLGDERFAVDEFHITKHGQTLMMVMKEGKETFEFQVTLKSGRNVT